MAETLGKRAIFAKIASELKSHGFVIERQDLERPWGGFFVIKETQASQFIKTYFPEEASGDLTEGRRVSPKILMVSPGKRLSWQYHHRRSEVWKILEGPVGVITSKTDEEGDLINLASGDKIIIAKEERHRLIGLQDFGLVAEIWRHTDPDHLSDEKDIVRLQDDHGRKADQ